MADETSTILNAAAEPVDTGVVDNPVVDPVNAASGAAGNPAPAPASTSFDKLVTPDGGLADNWRDLLPENIRHEKCLDSIKRFDALAQSYVAGQKAIGANKVAIPGPNATPDELEAFHKALGRPDTVDGYKLDDVFKDVPPELGVNSERLKKFQEFAFSRGWSNAEAVAACEFQKQLVMDELAAARHAVDEEGVQSEKSLRAEYGEKYAEIIAQCQKAVDTFGVGEVLKNANLLNNAEIIRMFAKIGASMSESKIKSPEASIQSDDRTRYNELIGDLNGPYYSKDHPLHNQAVEEVKQLVSRLSSAR